MSTSEKRKKSHDGFVCMYECGKYFFYSMHERMCTAQDTNISNMKDIVEI